MSSNLGFAAVTRSPSSATSFEPDQQRRYKFIGYMNDADHNRGYSVGFSPDGIDWTCAPRVLLPRGDRTAVGQDFVNGGFVMTSRGDNRGRDREAGHMTRRDIAVSRSPDLLNWTPGVRVFEGDDDDPPGTEFYGMASLHVGQPVDRLLGVLRPAQRNPQRPAHHQP